MAQLNRKTGWTLPRVKKIEVNTIPALVFQQKSEELYWLNLELWIAEKHFVIDFLYTKDGIQTVNNIIDSMKLEVHPTIQAAIQAGNVGDF